MKTQKITNEKQLREICRGKLVCVTILTPDDPVHIKTTVTEVIKEMLSRANENNDYALEASIYSCTVYFDIVLAE